MNPQTPRITENFNYSDIENWLVSYLSNLLEVAPETIDVSQTFESYGLDSSAAVGLSGDLQEWLKTELEPTLLFDYPTIEALSSHLANNN
ncbi:acyl carrier protein [Crocosphaera sp.]|uniref:acyl carrier protein n=1 Tax=Crocosphaera sp. TaxID=2729996 RepID=UPI003F26D172|nr:acyl carrier protein [Crocosphaera sp.]